MTPRRNQVALYVSSPNADTKIIDALQNTFDHPQDYPEIPTQPNYIHHLTEANEWSMTGNLNVGYEQIYERHRKENYPAFYAKPIIILDERTTKDRTVVMVSPTLDDNSGRFVTKWFRLVPEKVVAMNLQISNQDINDVSILYPISYCYFLFPLRSPPSLESIYRTVNFRDPTNTVLAKSNA